MTADWNDIADALRGLLICTGTVWLVYAWWRHVLYPRAMLGLAMLAVFDFLLHAFAVYAARPDSIIPDDFSVYSLYLLLAAVVGLTASLIYARYTHLALGILLDAALIVVIVGSLGARAYYVGMHWDYFAQNTDDIVNLAQGGLGWRGALAGGIFALWLFTLITRASLWKLVDAGAVGIALAQSIGWYGTSLVGANYGILSDATFAQDLPDNYGIIAPRVPVQAFAMIFFFVLLLALVWLTWRVHPRDGIVCLLFLILASLTSFALGAWRADDTLYWNSWRVDQWVDMFLASAGLVMLGFRILPQTFLLRRGTP